jgi:hypothetical protein
MITLKSLIKKISKQQDFEGYSIADKYPMGSILRDRLLNVSNETRYKELHWENPLSSV